MVSMAHDASGNPPKCLRERADTIDTMMASGLQMDLDRETKTSGHRCSDRAGTHAHAGCETTQAVPR